MSCAITLAGIARDCLASMGGVKKVYITAWDNVTAKTISSDVITAITMAASTKFYAYEFRPETASMESSLQVNKQNGTAYFHTALTLLFHHMTTAKRIEINAISAGEVAVIVEDNNGKFWYLGYDNPVTPDSGDSGTGTAYADANRYGIVLGDDSKDLPYEVSDSIISGLL